MKKKITNGLAVLVIAIATLLNSIINVRQDKKLETLEVVTLGTCHLTMTNSATTDMLMQDIMDYKRTQNVLNGAFTRIHENIIKELHAK
jgi:uncharacterized protein (DUF39 family)